jgi:hypothetical protein
VVVAPKLTSAALVSLAGGRGRAENTFVLRSCGGISRGRLQPARKSVVRAAVPGGEAAIPGDVARVPGAGAVGSQLSSAT